MGRLRGRLRRLLRALLAQEAPDDAFALRFLEGEERELYLAMDPRDRAHGVRVARRLLKAYPEAPGYAVRAALLHPEMGLGQGEEPRLLFRGLAVVEGLVLGESEAELAFPDLRAGLPHEGP